MIPKWFIIIIVLLIVVGITVLIILLSKNKVYKCVDGVCVISNTGTDLSSCTRNCLNPKNPKLVNLIWHPNNSMGDNLQFFPWDPQKKMKGNIKNFIVGIWPTWNEEDFNTLNKNNNSKYVGKLASKNDNSGDIMDAKSLINLSYEYAKSIGAKFIPYLLPAMNSWDPNVTNASDILIGLDGQVGILKTKFGIDCKGIIIEQEEHYAPNIMATQIFAAMKSPWSMEKLTTYIDNNTKIAWSEQGPMSPYTIQGYNFATDSIEKLGDKIKQVPDFTWPDSYEANWVNGWGHWTKNLLQKCNSSPGYGGCPPTSTMATQYGMQQDKINNLICCAGKAKGIEDNTIGRYCVPAKKWGPLYHNLLNTVNPEQTIFVAAGPGGDFAIKNSENISKNDCKQDENLLVDLVNGFIDAYGNDWKMRNGNSLALYG